MAANKKSSEKTAVCKIITNWFSCSWTINSWYHSLVPDYTCHSEECTEEEVLENSLHHLTPGPLPLHPALLSASVWQRLCPNLFWLRTTQLPLLTSDLQKQTRSSFPAWEEMSFSLLLPQGSDWAVDSGFLSAQGHLKSIDLCCWEQDLSVLHSHHSFSFLVC